MSRLDGLPHAGGRDLADLAALRVRTYHVDGDPRIGRTALPMGDYGVTDDAAGWDSYRDAVTKTSDRPSHLTVFDLHFRTQLANIEYCGLGLCPLVFRGPECRYSGDAGGCDKTPGCCKELGNLKRFQGDTRHGVTCGCRKALMVRERTAHVIALAPVALEDRDGFALS